MIKIIIACLVFAIFFISLYLVKRKRDVKRKQEYAKDEFFNNLKSFSGAFSALYQAVNKSDSATVRKLLTQWDKRLADRPELQGFFDEIAGEKSVKAGQAWLEQLGRWGLQHDEEGETICIGEETARFYLFDDVYEAGDKAKVVYPCWYRETDNGKILVEKGAAALIYEEDE